MRKIFNKNTWIKKCYKKAEDPKHQYELELRALVPYWANGIGFYWFHSPEIRGQRTCSTVPTDSVPWGRRWSELRPPLTQQTLKAVSLTHSSHVRQNVSTPLHAREQGEERWNCNLSGGFPTRHTVLQSWKCEGFGSLPWWSSPH